MIVNIRMCAHVCARGLVVSVSFAFAQRALTTSRKYVRTHFDKVDAVIKLKRQTALATKRCRVCVCGWNTSSV